jgi:ubiquinone/menaquinone biosynthesis C-methylase UbiE
MCFALRTLHLYYDPTGRRARPLAGDAPRRRTDHPSYSGIATVVASEMPAPRTKGLVMHSEARYYDVLAWLLTLGREQAFRDRLVDLARLEPGEAVLDVGCGTGTLAIAAKRRVGAAGTVHGVDASPEMIDRAKRKATKAAVDVVFQAAVVEALPFPDASFDAVLSTLMLHHLPRPAREQCAREMRRVLKPGGRVLAVDFATPARERKGLLARLHRHGHMALRDILGLLSDAGLEVVESGSVGVSDLQFVLATAPSRSHENRGVRAAPAHRSLEPLPAPRWVWPVLAIAVVAAHGIILRGASSRLALPALAVAAVAALLIMMHSGFAGVVHTLLRRRRRS